MADVEDPMDAPDPDGARCVITGIHPVGIGPQVASLPLVWAHLLSLGSALFVPSMFPLVLVLCVLLGMYMCR